METPTELSELIDGMTPTPDVEILAPCTHCKECSLKGNKAQWCHFAQQCEAGPTAVGYNYEHCYSRHINHDVEQLRFIHTLFYANQMEY